MSSSNLRTTGIVARIYGDRGYAFVSTDKGDVFVHATVAGQKWSQFVEGAQVELLYINSWNERAKTEADRYRMTATEVVSVVEPEIDEFVVLTQVLYFDLDKDFGRVDCGPSFSKPTAFLPGKVCRTSNMDKPGRRMPIRAVIIEGQKGPVVTSFEWGPKVEADYEASKPVITAMGELKHFDRAKKFGHLRLEDGSQIFFHLNGVAEELRSGFFTLEYKRATFEFAYSDFNGKPVALITKLVALAETVESVEVVAVQVTAPAEEAVSAPEIVVVAEPKAKSVKAPRKKVVTKPGVNVSGRSLATQLAVLDLNDLVMNGVMTH